MRNRRTLSFLIVLGTLGLMGLLYTELAFGATQPIDKPILLASSSKTFIFDPKQRKYFAIQNGKVVKQGRASGGRHYCPDVKRSCRTPSGVYRVTHKGGAGCRSSRYPLGRGGAPMPYCMFFSKYYAVHGSPDVPNYNASHGCIRVKPHDAAWLSRHFMDPGTRVIVKPY